jgi:hypothetical protein
MQAGANWCEKPRFCRGFLRFLASWPPRHRPRFRCNPARSVTQGMRAERHHFRHLSAPLWAPFPGHRFPLPAACRPRISAGRTLGQPEGTPAPTPGRERSRTCKRSS